MISEGADAAIRTSDYPYKLATPFDAAVSAFRLPSIIALNPYDPD